MFRSRSIGLAKPGKGLGIALADYDRDGHIDIFVANDSMLEFLYHNKGDGTFEDIALTSGVAVDGEGHTYAGMGADFADYNNDGLPGLVVTDLANQMYSLYRNNGDGTFTYDSYPSGLGGMTMTHSGWGVRFMDYDNDGWKDLLIAQGHDLDTIELTFPNLRYREPMLLARNTGHGFVDVSAEAGSVFHQAWVGRGLAIGDIDNDGRLDAVITTNDGFLYVLRNETISSNHWLILKLVGHKSNRDAIDPLRWGSYEARVIHTPGHTPGSVCLYMPKDATNLTIPVPQLFAGDTLFAGSIGRTDLWGGSLEKILASVKGKLMELPDETIVYPGHGPTTSIGQERHTNPFLI